MSQDIARRAEPGQYLTFRLKEQIYGVPIGVVREINQMMEITPVPETPDFVRGVMNLRGKVIPVVDLRQKFGLGQSSETKESCIIVIDREDGQVGTIIDSVSEVITLSSEAIEPPPRLGAEAKLAHLTGMGKLDGKVFILIDIVGALSKDSLSIDLSELDSEDLGQSA